MREQPCSPHQGCVHGPGRPRGIEHGIAVIGHGSQETFVSYTWDKEEVHLGRQPAREMEWSSANKLANIWGTVTEVKQRSARTDGPGGSTWVHTGVAWSRRWPQSPLPRMPAIYKTENSTERDHHCPGLIVSPSRMNGAPSKDSLATSRASLVLHLEPQVFLFTDGSSPQYLRKRVKSN